MPSGRSDRGSSRHSAGLLLRVTRPDGSADEFYLAGGLTIGRSVANTVVLADDDSVDRTHARVEVADDGSARLRCVEPDSSLTTGGESVRELPLDAGVRFGIGRTGFECVPGRRGADRPDGTSRTVCPYCTSTGISTAGNEARRCPSCNGLILPVLSDPHEKEPTLLPAVYGEYRAERYVARGGMGLVLKGVREGGTEAVAIKVLMPGSLTDRRDAELFEREVAMLERVRHPNVVKLLDHGKSGMYNFLALEWVEGPSLREVIDEARRAGRLPDFADASRWFGQVAKGLAAIHAVGLVHRDLKPSNILIGPDGAARVADLGIAKRVDGGHTSYTTTGHAPGTFEYMAPEQLAAPDTVDGRADLYALGVTFYELLTGARPVGAWRPASEVNPTVPRSFDAILCRLLATRPSDRHGDIHDLIAALRCLDPASSGVRGERERGIAPGRPQPQPPAMDVACANFPCPARLAIRSALHQVANVAGIVAIVGLFACVMSPRMRAHGIVGLIIALPLYALAGASFALWYWTFQFPFLSLRRWLLTGSIVGGLATLVLTGEFGSGLLVGFVTGPLGVIGRLALGSYGYDADSYLRWADTRSFEHIDMVVACLTEAIRLDPKNATAYYRRGNTLAALNDHARAIADYTEAIRLRPDWVEAFAARATARSRADDHEQAIADSVVPRWAR